jgi:hypothetical protein
MVRPQTKQRARGGSRPEPGPEETPARAGLVIGLVEAAGEAVADVNQHFADPYARIKVERRPGGKPRGASNSAKLQALTEDKARLTQELETARRELETSVGRADKAEQLADALDRMVRSITCELASCLWYIKTKQLGRKWSDTSTADPDPRTSKTLGRIARCEGVLARHKVVVIDQTGQRYVPGSEGFMKPLDMLPTPSITHDTIQETIKPAIQINGGIVQTGEVFVAVPAHDESAPPPQAAGEPDPAADDQTVTLH